MFNFLKILEYDTSNRKPQVLSKNCSCFSQLHRWLSGNVLDLNFNCPGFKSHKDKNQGKFVMYKRKQELKSASKAVAWKFADFSELAEFAELTTTTTITSTTATTTATTTDMYVVATDLYT